METILELQILMSMATALRASMRGVDLELKARPQDITALSEREKLKADIKIIDKLILKVQTKVVRHFEDKYSIKLSAFTKVRQTG